MDSGASVQILDVADTEIDASGDWVITESSTTNGPMALLVNLNNDWGFDPNGISTIQITIDGKTEIGVGDRDMLVSFSVDSSKFFSVGLRMDNGADGFIPPLNGISACDNNTNPTQPLFAGMSIYFTFLTMYWFEIIILMFIILYTHNMVK